MIIFYQVGYKMTMTVKVFDTLTQKDFANGAIRDEIRNSLKEIERISTHISRQPNAADGNNAWPCQDCGSKLRPYHVWNCKRLSHH